MKTEREDPNEQSAADTLRAAAAQTSNIPELKRLIEDAAQKMANIEWRLAAAQSQAERAEDQIEELKAARKNPEEQLADQLLKARITAIRALVKLLPKAIRQANAGKPALLRLILRSTK
jgi:chemotaxis protein histidine kinase CheA